MQDKVEVAQEDRDRAADWYVDGEGLVEAYRARIQNGDWDDDQLVQMLARHREQAFASLREERDALRALLEGRDKFIVDAGLWHQFVDSLPSAMGEG